MSNQKKRASVADVMALVDEKHGNVAAIARALGVARPTIYKRINESVNLQEALSSARETMLDNVESALYSQALNDNTTAMIFFLKTQGKSRGYTERQEITGIDGNPVNFIVSISNNGHQD
jgi:hypothetical protein